MIKPFTLLRPLNATVLLILNATVPSYCTELCCTLLSLGGSYLNAKAAEFLSEGLKTNTGLTALKYAAYQTSSQLARTVNHSQR